MVNVKKTKVFCLRNSSILTARAILEKKIFLKDRFIYIESKDLFGKINIKIEKRTCDKEYTLK